MSDRFHWHPETQVFGDKQHLLKDIFAAINANAGFCLPHEMPARVTRFAQVGPQLQCMSSGTTGTARAIRRSHLSWIKSFERNAGMWAIRAQDTYAVLGALSHSLALYGAMEAVHLGADLHILTGQRPDRQMQALSQNQISILYATPAQIRGLCGAPCQNLRKLLIGGARLDTATRTHAQTQFPNADIFEFYGASETSFIALADHTTPEGSVGQAYPGAQISILDANGTPQPAGADGLVWVSGPYLFDDYIGPAAPATQRVDDRITVGECGALDENGNLTLKGRYDRMVAIADQNIYPEEIETFLLSQPEIQNAAIIAVADEKRGHILRGFIQGGDAETVLKHCRTTLGPLKSPRQLISISQWPTLPSGKTDLQALKGCIK
ncbi:AMP-binding protein [Cochlodiniinecator piscidefendens]|uniref:AMP-binding protein n=1 Tax=Cochlodiniinecator piscidefendens TaxID=2715756 RepID=UPI001409347D|nr:AMP-binding protein [Cochlodiniinecator piscidefendens]